MQFVTCRIGEQLFGVDIQMVREINKVLDITPIPKEQPHIRGLINLRGQIVTILDMRVRLGMEPQDHSETTHNIIVKGGAELRNALGADGDSVAGITDPSGLLVDDIGDVVDAGDHEVEPPPANVGMVDGGLLSGVVKKEDTLVAILNVPRVIAL
jgi:purine-binding chemotaxis protein CheW